MALTAYGLRLIFDVPSEDARLPSRYSGGATGQFFNAHWSGKVVRHLSSSQSIDSQSESDPECSEAASELGSGIFSEARKFNDSYVIRLPCFTPNITKALNAYRLCLPPSALLVAYANEPRAAVILLSDNSSTHVLQKRALVDCLEALELDGVTQVYVAVRKSTTEQLMSPVTPLLKTLMFLGFEIVPPESAHPELACLTMDYRLLFTSLHE
ncbi:Fibrillin 2 [Paragonimus heterotremus]|uniref:Fibrillin 2 n=1 Tax=Paragonimus heterotremus TaxID=100268 RepID=A0A8J4T319_9TREM|nr:Fibrillin 2 [Paragonimus heterotremus]